MNINSECCQNCVNLCKVKDRLICPVNNNAPTTLVSTCIKFTKPQR